MQVRYSSYLLCCLVFEVDRSFILSLLGTYGGFQGALLYSTNWRVHYLQFNIESITKEHLRTTKSKECILI